MHVYSETITQASKELLTELGYFVDRLWHVNDVHLICEQQGLQKLTNEEAMQVFAIAVDQFDGDVGITWPQLEKALHIYMQQKALLNAACVYGDGIS